MSFFLQLLLSLVLRFLSDDQAQGFFQRLRDRFRKPAEVVDGKIVFSDSPLDVDSIQNPKGTLRDLLRDLFRRRNPSPSPLTPDAPPAPQPGKFSWWNLIMAVIAAVATTVTGINFQGCTPAPQPAPPAPGPAPTPPDPAPPAPLDAETKRIAAKFADAYRSDSGSEGAKSEAKRWLTNLYAAAADFALDPKVTGTADLLGRIREAAGAKLTPTDLPGLRLAIAVEIGGMMPTEGTLDDARRRQASELFRRVSTALGSF